MNSMKEKEIVQLLRFKKYLEVNKLESFTRIKFHRLYMFNLVLDVYLHYTNLEN